MVEFIQGLLTIICIQVWYGISPKVNGKEGGEVIRGVLCTCVGFTDLIRNILCR
jgi:hypothetical protein